MRAFRALPALIGIACAVCVAGAAGRQEPAGTVIVTEPAEGWAKADVYADEGVTRGLVIPRRAYRFKPAAGGRLYTARPGDDLQEAADKLLPGDVLQLKGGTYASPFLVDFRVHNVPRARPTEAAPIVITAAPGEQVKIVQPAGWQAAHLHQATVGINLPYVTVNELNVAGCRQDKSTWSLYDEFGQNAIALLHPNEGVRILNCAAHHALHCGIKADGGCLVEGCIVFDNGRGVYDHGLYLSGSHTIARGNACLLNANQAIHCYGPAGVEDFQIYNNLCLQSINGGLVMAFANSVVANNVLIDTTDKTGYFQIFLFRKGCHDTQFVNNIVDRGQGAAEIGFDAAGPDDAPRDILIDNNVMPTSTWANGKKGNAQPRVAGFDGGHNRITSALDCLIDPARDLRTRPGSPAAGKACPVKLKGARQPTDIGLFPATLYE